MLQAASRVDSCLRRNGKKAGTTPRSNSFPRARGKRRPNSCLGRWGSPQPPAPPQRHNDITTIRHHRSPSLFPIPAKAGIHKQGRAKEALAAASRSLIAARNRRHAASSVPRGFLPTREWEEGRHHPPLQLVSPCQGEAPRSSEGGPRREPQPSARYQPPRSATPAPCRPPPSSPSSASDANPLRVTIT